MSTQSTDLARLLSEGIASGVYAVGDLLPTEFELCERHSLSRYAVRKALDELHTLGLISRRKNVGTRVEASAPAAGFTQTIATVGDLAQFGAEHVREVRAITEIVTDLALAQELGCAGGTRWLRISSLRREGADQHARPLCWTDVYVEPAYAELGALVRASPHTLVSSLIESRFGRSIARIRQDIQAVLMPKTTSLELGVEAGTPALQITRRYVDAANAVFEVSVSLHPADRFTFSMDLSRSRD